MGPVDTSRCRNLDDWQVGAIRLTAFVDPLAPPESRTEGSQWEHLIGKAPENVISRTYGTEHEENGPFSAGGKLSYKRSPRVAEWFLEPVQDPEGPETAFWMSPAVVLPFKELLRRWLVSAPACRRMAFGAALYLPVQDEEEGLRELSRCLRLELNTTHLGDFLYQVNRRRPSSCDVPNLEINRLSKWSWLQLELRAGRGEQSWPAMRRSVCLLELDINTALDYRSSLSRTGYVPFQGTLPRESYVTLFNELVAFAEEIAVRGDIP